MINEIVDVNNKPIKVGNKIAWGEATSSYNCCIFTGEVLEIQKKPIETYIKVRILENGSFDELMCNYYKENVKIKYFKYPRYYNNIIIL